MLANIVVALRRRKPGLLLTETGESHGLYNIPFIPDYYRKGLLLIFEIFVIFLSSEPRFSANRFPKGFRVGREDASNFKGPSESLRW
jgi:hypothetical protein